MNNKKIKTPAEQTSESNTVSISVRNTDATHLKELREAAKKYIKQGFSVVPMGCNGKEGNYKLPLIRWREEGPIKTLEELDTEFNRLGSKVFGIALPVEKRIFVDFDTKDTNRLFRIDEVPTISTGKGFHMWYAPIPGFTHNGPVDLKEFELRDSKKYQLEIYTAKRLEIVPPSQHHSGVKYEWLVSSEEFNTLPELPPEIRDLCGKRELKGRIPLLSRVEKGERHNRCIKVARDFSQKFSGNQAMVEQATFEWNQKYCEEPLDESEVRKIVEWAVRMPFFEEKNARPTKSKRILELILENDSVIFFHDQDGNGYARVPHKGRQSNVPIQGTEFAEYVRYTFYRETGESVSEQHLNEVLGVCNAKAVYEHEQHALYHRVAQLEDVIYYDLLNEKGEVVEIDKEGWRVVSSTKVPFLFKSGSCKEQVMPLPGGDLKDLIDLINIKDPNEQMLFLCTLPIRLIRNVDQAIAYIYGPAGSAKTTLLKMVKELIDPSKGAISMPIRKIEDGTVMLSQSWLFANDNVSKIGNSLSDFFCVVATGAESSKRKLYTDTDVSVVSVKNPVFITGINIEAYRSDLLSRILLFKTEMVPTGKRRSAEEVNTRFEKLKPYLLGALFDILSKAMRVRKDKELKSEFRMADFGIWGAACAEVMGYGAEYFESVLQISTKERAYEAIYSSSVGRMVLELMKDCVEFSGTMTELLRDLKNLPSSNWGGEGGYDSQEIVAHNPASLGKKLRELENSLGEIGITVDFGKRSSSERVVTIRKQETDSSPKSTWQDDRNDSKS